MKPPLELIYLRPRCFHLAQKVINGPFIPGEYLCHFTIRSDDRSAERVIDLRLVVLIPLVTQSEKVGDRSNFLIAADSELPNAEVRLRSLPEISEPV